VFSGGKFMHAGRAALAVVFALQLLDQTGLAKMRTVHLAPVINCTQATSEKVSMHSTDRLPEASGAARVECKGGTTGVEVEVTSMKPASLFGGDYNTYVLWVVPPRGRAENLGEIQLDGTEAKIQGSTSAAVFAILVTAEPHYLVSVPSAFIVLENDSGSRDRIIEQPVIEGVYNFARSSLDDAKEAKGKVHTEVKQAFTAVRLAQRAGAATLAGEEFAQAQRALDQTMMLWRERRDRAEIAAQARETIQLAVAAQSLAHGRALQETRVETEGPGGGKGETEGRDPRGTNSGRR
jgi:hypothetical protein